MPKKAGLGKDFFSIMDDNTIEEAKGSASTLRISDIEPRSNQPRKDFEHEALEQLADSISVYGVLQPIIVRENPNAAGTYEIIAGERRWRAAKMAGLSEIPAVILEGDELKAAQVALIENIQREDLNPVEEAFGYQYLIENFGLKQEEVAQQVGKSRSAVANMLRLIDLPEEVLELLKDGSLSTGHARALLGLEREEDMLPLAQKVIAKALNVRDTERAVKALNAAADENEVESTFVDASVRQRKVYMKDLERRALSSLGRKVRITDNGKKQTLEIAYNGDDDLESLLKLLCGDDFFNA